MKKLLCIVATLFLLMSMATGLAVDVYTEDILSNYGLILDGTPVQLPVPASTLISKGWFFQYAEPDPSWPFGKTKEESVLPAMTYDSTRLYKGNQSISVYLVNATDAEKQYEECSIAGIGLFKTDGVPFTMNNGISFASSCEEVCAAYGLDKEAIAKEYTSESTGFTVSFYIPEKDGIHTDKGISYVEVGMNQIDFQFDKPLSENGTLEYILIRYMNGAPEAEEEPAKEEPASAEPSAETQSSGLWTCTACGMEENKGNFCENCGAPKPEEGPRFCPNCGEKIAEGTHPNFCENCGTKL